MKANGGNNNISVQISSDRITDVNVVLSRLRSTAAMVEDLLTQGFEGTVTGSLNVVASMPVTPEPEEPSGG
jgi:hypothetical protein